MGASSIKLIWIDDNVNSFENRMYSNRLKFNLETFTSVQEGINKIKQIQFKKIIIMTKGSMIKDLISVINLEKIKIYNSLDIIIFTRKEHKEFIKLQCVNDQQISKFFNVSNIFVDIDEVINYLNNNSIITNNEEEIFDTIGKAIKISNYKELIQPLYYMNSIESPTNEEIKDFNYFLKNCFGKDMKELIIQLENNSKLPNEIICKYWARAYTIESPFYKIMNKRLREKKGKLFVTFIKMMYEGIRNGVFTPIQANKFYRGGTISNNEFEKIKNYFKNNNNKEYFPSSILYIRPFLSFSIDKDVAFKFMKSMKDHKAAIFIVNNHQNIYNKDLYSYGYFYNYSIYKKEKEVLFFPYSCFKIEDIKELYNRVEIYLEYLGKYKEYIEKNFSIDEIFNDIPDTEFGREISDLGLINYNYKKYWEIVKEIKINIGNVSCLLYFGKEKLLYSVNENTILYDIIKDRIIQIISEHEDEIIDLLKVSELCFVSSSKDKTIKYFKYDFNGFKLIESLKIHNEQVNQTINLKNCQFYLFASCSNDKNIKIWNFKHNNKNSEIITLNGHKNNIISIFELKNGNLVSLSEEGLLKFWSYNNNSNSCIKTFENFEYPLKNSFSFLNDNIIIVGTKKGLFLVDITKKEIIKRFYHQYIASSIGYLKKNILFGYSTNNNICLLKEYNIEDNIYHLDIECIGNGKDLCLEISEIINLDEDTIVTANKNNFIKIWERKKEMPNLFMCDNKTKIKDFDKNKNQKKCKLIENMKAKEEENEKKENRKEENEKEEIKKELETQIEILKKENDKLKILIEKDKKEKIEKEKEKEEIKKECEKKIEILKRDYNLFLYKEKKKNEEALNKFRNYYIKLDKEKKLMKEKFKIYSEIDDKLNDIKNINKYINNNLNEENYIFNNNDYFYDKKYDKQNEIINIEFDYNSKSKEMKEIEKSKELKDFLNTEIYHEKENKNEKKNKIIFDSPIPI